MHFYFPTPLQSMIPTLNNLCIFNWYSMLSGLTIMKTSLMWMSVQGVRPGGQFEACLHTQLPGAPVGPQGVWPASWAGHSR